MWFGTLNNCKINGKDLLEQWLADDKIVYGVCQLEKGKERGTEHLQVYVVTKDQRTRTWLQKELFKGAWDLRMGTHDQARDYCMKNDTRVNGPWEVGSYDPSVETNKARGQRGGKQKAANVAEMVDRIKQGATDREILDEFPQFSTTMGKGIERVRLILAQDQRRTEPYCVVFHGPTGTGKSHRANAIMKNNGGGFIFRKGNSGNMWADGYDPLRHPVVIFDEMDGAFMSYRQLLRVCDKWPLVLDTKGGAINFTPKIIIFTSSKHPKDWYSVESVPDTTEMMRRLSGKRGAIIEMKTPYAQQEEIGPDLKDVIDLLETGELVDNISAIITPHLSQEPEEGETDDRDLTDSEEFAQREAEEAGESMYDIDYTDISHLDNWEAAGRQETYEDEDAALVAAAEEIERQHARKIKRTEEFGALKVPVVAGTPIKKTTPLAQLSVVKPPKANPADFKKIGQIPGQSKLSLTKRPRQDDDDDE